MDFVRLVTTTICQRLSGHLGMGDRTAEPPSLGVGEEPRNVSVGAVEDIAVVSRWNDLIRGALRGYREHPRNDRQTSGKCSLHPFLLLPSPLPPVFRFEVFVP